MARRAFINLQKGVREQCIDRANVVRADKHYRMHGCKVILHYLRIASYRACVMRRAYDQRCQVLNIMFFLISDHIFSWDLKASSVYRTFDVTERRLINFI